MNQHALFTDCQYAARVVKVIRAVMVFAVFDITDMRRGVVRYNV